MNFVNRPPLVIFHSHCTDGTCAAWIARSVAPEAEFHAWSYEDPPPSRVLYASRRVLILDFSFPRAILTEMAEQCDLQVIDHHKTAAANLAGLEFCEFDMARSGAGLAWDVLRGGPRPWIVDYVEDRDLWRNALPNSEDVVAAIHELPRGVSGRQVTPDLFATWDAMSHLRKGDVALAGNYHRKTSLRLAEEIANKAMTAELGGMTAAVACGSVLYSDAADILCRRPLPSGKLPDFAAVFWMTSSGRFTYSLRSRGDVDVSEVAKQYGGGGHAGCAGFTADVIVHKRINCS